MKIKIHQLEGLMNGLQCLDGHTDAVEVTKADGSGETQRVLLTRPYSFSCDRVRMNIARNLETVASELRAYTRARESLHREVFSAAHLVTVSEPAGDAGVCSQLDLSSEFEERFDALLQSEIDAALHPVAVTDLNPEHNKIPPSVLAALSPILTYPDSDD